MKTASHVVSAWVFVALILVLVGDGVWFFARALPRHPPGVYPTPPPATATSAQIDRYRLKADRAQVQDWDRREVMYVAAGIPIAAFAIVILTVVFVHEGHGTKH